MSSELQKWAELQKDDQSQVEIEKITDKSKQGHFKPQHIEGSFAPDNYSTPHTYSSRPGLHERQSGVSSLEYSKGEHCENRIERAEKLARIAHLRAKEAMELHQRCFALESELSNARALNDAKSHSIESLEKNISRVQEELAKSTAGRLRYEERDIMLKTRLKEGEIAMASLRSDIDRVKNEKRALEVELLNLRADNSNCAIFQF